MEKKIIISSEKIPAAIGPYSQAVKVGKLMFISGQLPVEPESGNLVKGDIQKQTKQILENLTALLDFVFSCPKKCCKNYRVFKKHE